MSLNKFEEFFFTKIEYLSDVNNNFFDIPTCKSFSYFLNSLVHFSKLTLSEKLNDLHLKQISSYFLKFLDNDKILVNVDSLSFAYLYKLIKKMKEGSVSDLEDFSCKIIRFSNKYLKRYFEYVCDKLISISGSDEWDENTLDYLSTVFINELLSSRVDIRFIYKMCELYRKGQFNDFKSFVEYFLNKNSDNYEVLIPIKNTTDEILEILKTNHTIVNLSDTYFIKIKKENTIDYFSFIAIEMIKIDSVFNLIKLYKQSDYGFDYSKAIIVKISGERNINAKIPFTDLVKYKGLSLNDYYLENVSTNLNLLKNVDEISYKKILNVISYSEKDNDFLSTTSYVDTWIALESFFSLSERYSGFKSVYEQLPSYLSSKVILNRLNYFTKKSSFRASNLNVFVKNSIENKIESSLKYVKNPYYSFAIKQLSVSLSNLKNLSSLYTEIEDDIGFDLFRIYLLRNEYVHESNLTAYKNVEPFKEKNYLIAVADMLFTLLSQKNRVLENSTKDRSYIYRLFGLLNEKCENRKILFDITTTKQKYNNSNSLFELKELGSVTNLEDVICNTVFFNFDLPHKFVKQSAEKVSDDGIEEEDVDTAL